MPDDALAKAAEAVEDFLREEFCAYCHPPTYPDVCEMCKIKAVDEESERIARTVLEAAAAEDLLAVARLATDKRMREVCVSCFGRDCEDCVVRELVKTAKAALARAGKEA